uniref:RBP-Jkappa IPT domain-containing protein n=1 Tax=Ditylenchus dipsaci TaxID=166011 RepID=A0A915E2S7_9BILA
MEGDNSHAATAIELAGFNFNSSLKVWFGSSPAETSIRSTELIRCTVPPFSHGVSCSEFDKLDVPISLVRNDGVIYATGMRFTYSTPSRPPMHLNISEQHLEFKPSLNNIQGVQRIATGSSNMQRFHPYPSN